MDIHCEMQQPRSQDAQTRRIRYYVQWKGDAPQMCMKASLARPHCCSSLLVKVVAVWASHAQYTCLGAWLCSDLAWGSVKPQVRACEIPDEAQEELEGPGTIANSGVLAQTHFAEATHQRRSVGFHL